LRIDDNLRFVPYWTVAPLHDSAFTKEPVNIMLYKMLRRNKELNSNNKEIKLHRVYLRKKITWRCSDNRENNCHPNTTKHWLLFLVFSFVGVCKIKLICLCRSSFFSEEIVASCYLIVFSLSYFFNFFVRFFKYLTAPDLK
jgi:hypothetical protein